MTTTYILHGGFIKDKPQINDAFYSEVLHHAPQNANILLVYFASDPGRALDKSKEGVEQFTNNNSGKLLHFDVANDENFRTQIAWADVVYLCGGTSTKILQSMQPFASELLALFAGKIVAADSAGANILSTVFYSKVADQVLNGFGLLPIKLICHYKEEYERKLDGIEPDLEVVRLNEFQFRRITVE